METDQLRELARSLGGARPPLVAPVADGAVVLLPNGLVESDGLREIRALAFQPFHDASVVALSRNEHAQPV